MNKYILICLLITLPVLSWFITPIIAVNSHKTCRAKTLKIYDDGNIKMVAHSHWNTKNQYGKGAGYYSDEVQYINLEKKRNERWNLEVAFTTSHKYQGSYVEIKTENVSRITGTPESLHLLNSYIYPSLVPGYIAVATFHRGPEKTIMLGSANEIPRVLCFD